MLVNVKVTKWRVETMGNWIGVLSVVVLVWFLVWWLFLRKPKAAPQRVDAEPDDDRDQLKPGQWYSVQYVVPERPRPGDAVEITLGDSNNESYFLDVGEEHGVNCDFDPATPPNFVQFCRDKKGKILLHASGV